MGLQFLRSAAGAALAVALTVPGGAADAPRQSYTIAHVLRYATGEDIVGLNPHLNAQLTLQFMSSLTMAWLVRYDHANRPIPELATAVPTRENHGISADGKTITYHLRRDAKWSDGVAFTSADVKFSVAVVQDADNNEQTHEGFSEVTAVDTPDPQTAVFHLRRPYASYYISFFSPAGGSPCLLPQHVLVSTKINTAAYNELPIGIGPFKYAAWKRSDSVEMVANPLYFGAKPKLERIVFKIIPDRNTVLTQLTTHEIDLWLPVSPAFADRVKHLPGISVLQQPSYLYDHVDFNLAHPPLDDRTVREALRLAIDRPTILAKIRHGNGLLQEGVLAPAHPYFDPSIAKIPYDISRANALLDRAGWRLGADGIRAKNGKRLDFTYASGVGLPDTDQQIELIRASWKQIGANFTVVHYPSSTFFAPAQTGGIIMSGKFDITNFAWSDNPNGDLSNIYGCDRIPPKGQNVGRYCSPSADVAMTRFLGTYDSGVQRSLDRSIQERLVGDVGTVVIEVRKDTFAFNSDLKNFHPNQLSAFDAMLDVDI